MKNSYKIIKYIEIFILITAIACCFMPCLKYDNNMVINIYVFDANKIMGYLYIINNWYYFTNKEF